VSVLAQAALPRDITLRDWLLEPTSWTGPTGILTALVDTLQLSGAVVGTAVVLAVPSAALLAHLRRARVSSAALVNLGRAVPTFALAALLVPFSLRAGYGFEPWPIFIALTLLALPPIYLGTYTAITGVDPVAIEAARAVGLRPLQVLVRIEVPLAGNVILTGVRIAAVQVVATEPIRAFLGGDGLGRYVRDGLGQRNNTLLVGGAALVAMLAGTVALVLTGAQRLLEPVGVRRLRASAAPRDRGAPAAHHRQMVTVGPLRRPVGSEPPTTVAPDRRHDGRRK
jgi:osmoprotectant transport system permease protein